MKMPNLQQQKLILAAGLCVPMLVWSHSGHSGDEAPAEKSVDYRTSYMTILNWNAKPMIKMLKGEAEFDDAAFMAYARQLATASRLDLLQAFPEDSLTDDSDAKDEIWFTWEDFEQKFADFRAAADALGEAAASGDVAATKEAFAAVGDACKACHKKYKE